MTNSERANAVRYDDEHPSCVRTYSTLRVFSEEVSPEEISQVLGLEPTASFRKGDAISPRLSRSRLYHGWLLCTKGVVASRGTRRHIDWLLDQLEPAAENLRLLTARGVQADVYSFWESAQGQGGPSLSVAQMSRLVRFGLECAYDVYFASDEDGGTPE